jgi:threonine/homoserine/homoserine lactone efflux protein
VSPSSLLTFVAAVVLISASPGPAMALVLRRAALRGLRGAVPTVLGLELGLYAWALLAAGGFAALVAASEVAHLVLRVVGGVVLIVLGVRAWHGVLRDRRTPTAPSLDDLASTGRLPATTRGAAARRGWWTAFGEGALVQLANPKAAVFMIAFYPQFVPADRPLFATTAVLALAQVAVEIVLYLALAAGVARAGAWFRRPRVRRRLDAVSGTVFIALGLRVATTP